MHSPLWRSHTRMLLSSDPDQSVFPSLKRLTEVTSFECPQGLNHFPLWRSHTRMLLSHDPDQSVFPSLERPPNSLALSVLSGFKCILRFGDPTCCCPMIQIKAFSHRSKGSQNSLRVNVLSGFNCIFRFGVPHTNASVP